MVCLAWPAFFMFLATADLEVERRGLLIFVRSEIPRLWVAYPGGACHGGAKA